MAIEKQTMGSNDIIEPLEQTSAEQKAKSGAKVLLVKPLREPEKNQAEASVEIAATNEVPAAKKKPRPKVGRAAPVRKKKSEAKESDEKKPKAERTESADKPAEKTASEKDVEVKASAAAEISEKTETRTQSATAQPSTVREPQITSAGPVLTRATLREELSQMESPHEWTPHYSRPWSFKFIFLCVALFVLVNLFFMSFFKVEHRTHESPATPTFKTSADKIGAMPKSVAPTSAPAPVAAQSPPIAPAPVLAPAQAPVPAPSSASSPASGQNRALNTAVTPPGAPATQAAGDAQQLLSILEKN